MAKVTSGALDLNVDTFFSDFSVDLEVKFAKDNAALNFMDFYNNEVDHDAWGIKLNKRQLLIPKLFYGLELDEEDQEIVEGWSNPGIDRCTYDKDFGPTRRQSLVLEAGRRGSKSLTASVIAGFEWYKLCMLENPQRHYQMASSSRITMVCVATTASQTERTIFGELSKFITFIPKIKRYIDREEIEVLAKEIRWPNRNLYIYSGNSSSGAQVGGAIICLVLDEAARFDNDNALELWSNLGIGGMTFKYDAVRIAISSAWKEKDAIQVLYNSCRGEQSTIGFRMRSWDLNPIHGSRDNPIVANEYALNPAKAALEFEGIRGANDSSFFQQDIIKKAFTHMSTISAIPNAKTDNLVRLTILHIEPYYGRTVMHLDPAISKDRYGVAFGHTELIGGVLHVFIDGLLAWLATGGDHVSILNVQNCIYEVHEKRPLALVTADHFQQSETLQRLTARGIKTQTLTAHRRYQYESYTATRDLMSEGRLHLPKNSMWTPVLKDEFMYIQDLGNKVDHLPDKSKDLTDCVTSVVWSLIGNTMAHNQGMNRILTYSNSTNHSKSLYATTDDDSFSSKKVRGKNGWTGMPSDFL